MEYNSIQSQLTMASARLIKQKNTNFSRLYNSTKSCDTLIPRVWRDNKWTRGIPFYPAPNESKEGIMKECIEIHGRDKLYVLCSGGKDSISAVHYISTNYPDNFEGVLFIDTTMGVKGGREWLEGYCKDMGWKIEIAKPKMDVLDFSVKKWGFPSYGIHTYVMRLAKLIPMRDWLKGKSKSDRDIIGLTGGIRKYESIRRMGNYKTPLSRDGTLFFASPLFTMQTEEVVAYLKLHKLQKSPISDILGYSGECNEGAFAQAGQLEKIAFLDSALYKRIRKLEEWIDTVCTDPYIKKHNRFGGNIRYSQDQHKMAMKSLGVDKKFMTDLKNMEAQLCGTECGAGTMRGAGFV